MSQLSGVREHECSLKNHVGFGQIKIRVGRLSSKTTDEDDGLGKLEKNVGNCFLSCKCVFKESNPRDDLVPRSLNQPPRLHYGLEVIWCRTNERSRQILELM